MGFISGIQGWLNIRKTISIIGYINDKPNRNHMIISIVAKKAFDKIQFSFLWKTLKSTGINGAFLKIQSSIYLTPKTSIICNGNNTDQEWGKAVHYYHYYLICTRSSKTRIRNCKNKIRQWNKILPFCRKYT